MSVRAKQIILGNKIFAVSAPVHEGAQHRIYDDHGQIHAGEYKILDVEDCSGAQEGPGVMTNRNIRRPKWATKRDRI